mgnify:CR=1 FL=1
MDITQMQYGAVLRGRQVNASANRERLRQRRLLRLVVVLGVPLAWFWYREISGRPVRPGMPDFLSSNPQLAFLAVMLILITGMMLIPMMASGRSPHTMLRPGDFLLYSKRDLGGAPAPAPDGVARFHVSARTSAGMPEFLAALESRARDLAGGSEGAAFTRLRHVEAGNRALAALDRARERLPTAAELAAEDVRLAARALMSITGAVDVEDVLAEIFASFCIGK